MHDEWGVMLRCDEDKTSNEHKFCGHNGFYCGGTVDIAELWSTWLWPKWMFWYFRLSLSLSFSLSVLTAIFQVNLG